MTEVRNPAALSLLGLSLFALIVPAQAEGIFAYVTHSIPGDDKVSVIDVATNTLVSTLQLDPGTEPRAVAITPDGAFAYVVQNGPRPGQVTVINTFTNRVVDSLPNFKAIELAFTPDGDYAYFTSNDTYVSVVDTLTNTVTVSVPTEHNTTSVAITPDGAFAYVGGSNSNIISVIDTSMNVVATTVAMSSTRHTDIAIAPDGAFAYVAHDDSDYVSVIATATNAVVTTVPVGDQSHAVAITPDGAFAYVVRRNSANVSVIDTATNSVVATVPVGSFPKAVAITADGAFAYVANSLTSGVWVIDTATNAVIARVPVTAWSPGGIAIMSQPNYFDDVPPDHWAFAFIRRLASTGITGGCGNNNYCPDQSVTRAQMAVLLERGMRGRDFLPPPPTGNVFADVPASHWAAGFIEQLLSDGITSGCGNNNYCPDAEVTRAEMAVFLLRARYGAGHLAPPATGVFDDVPVSYWVAHWIEQLAAEGITAGCGNNNFCPEAPVTRAQMAVFLVRTFEL